jgi:hypothetical protein
MFRSEYVHPNTTAGYYVRRASGWSRVPAEVSTKIFEWNTDAGMHNMDGPLTGHIYNRHDDAMSIHGERFVYEVRMRWTSPTVDFAKIHFADGSWGEVRNSARPRDEGLWHAETGRYAKLTEE